MKMYLAVIIFVILDIFTVPSLGDMLMESKTYKIRATATNKEGKLINVSGTLMDFKLLSLTPEGEINNDDYTFSIVAKEITNSLADSDNKLGASPKLNSPTAGSSGLLPKSWEDSAQQKNKPIVYPSNFNSFSVENSLYKSNEAQTQFNRAYNNFDNVPASSRKNPPLTRPSGRPLLPIFRNISATQTPSEKIEDNSTTPSNKSEQPAKYLLQNSSTWPAGGELPQTSQPNVAQFYATPLSDDSNDSFREESKKTQIPSQTFHTEPLQQAKSARVQTPHRNVFDQRNSETYQEHGPHADDMASFPLANNFEKAHPERLSKVANVSLTPINNVTSIDLEPIRGKPWINQTSKNDGTQIYANTPEINMLLPLQNISVSGSSSKHDNSTTKYASLDPESLLQELEPVNQTTINRIIDDYFDNEQNDSMTVDDALNMSLINKIINKVEDMFNDQPEIFTEPQNENTSFEVIPTGLDVVEIVEVITEDNQGTTMTEKTIWSETTNGENSTAASISHDSPTTESNGSIVNVSTADMGNLSGTAKGNTVAPSGLAVVQLITVSIVIRSIVSVNVV